MRLTTGVFSVLVTVIVICNAARAGDEPKPVLSHLDLKAGDCIVFLGDSITHQLLYTQYVEDYFFTRFPKLRLKFHNAGVGGAQCWDALQRFDRDVAAFKPKYVTILLGMNDGHYMPFDQPTFDTYRKDMRELVRKITDIGATPVLMTPTMFDGRQARKNSQGPSNDNQELYNSVLSYYGTWLRDVAVENGHGFVDMWGPLNAITVQQRKKTATFTLIEDAVHPGPDGQLVMAAAIINDLELPTRLSTIRIVQRQGTAEAPAVEGGKVTGLRMALDRLEFTWSADGLPWVVPEAASRGVRLTNMGHRWSLESLQVHGLRAGRYKLTIDDHEVGTYYSDALVRHIELQSNDKTPQYQQAREVAFLNQQRCEGPVQRIRDAWGQFQEYSRAKRSQETEPANDELKQRIAELEKSVADLDSRVAAELTAMRKLEDEIYAKAQPVPHKYVLTRIAGGGPTESP